MPPCRHVQSGDGVVLEPDGAERLGMLGRRRLHADRYLPVRDVYGLQSRDLHGERSVPCRGHVQSGNGDLFEPHGPERNDLQRRPVLLGERHVPERDVHGGSGAGLLGSDQRVQHRRLQRDLGRV